MVVPIYSIEVVLFDADGVIQTTPALFRSRLEGLLTNSAHSSEFITDIFEAEKPCLTGKLDFTRELDEVLKRWDCSVSTEDALKVWQMIEPNTGILELISDLRKSGVYVALASNQQKHRAEFMSRGLGYAEIFDDLFFSCELGYAKPDVGFFSLILDRLELPGDSILFLDDHQMNVDAAKNSGMEAEVYNLDFGVEAMRQILEKNGVNERNNHGNL